MLEKIDDTTIRLTYRLPFREGPPPVHIYFLDAERPALLDTGPNDEGVFEQLKADLASIGRRIESIADVVVSHHHMDHAGLAGRIAEISGARLHLHPADIPAVSSDPDRRAVVLARIAELAVYWGVPPEAQEAIPRSYDGFFKFAPEVPDSAWTPLEPGALELAERSFLVIHCPGHTAGLCVLWEEATGYLFGNDHLLAEITSNPASYVPPYRGRRTGLADYLDSLEKVRPLPARLVLPGHGPSFTNVDRRVVEILAEYRERRGRILEVLSARAPTILDLVGEIWTARELSPTHLYLACREVHGHLDILLAEGLATEGIVSGISARFRGVPSVD